MRKITKAIQADIKKELTTSSDILIEVISTDLRFQENKISLLDISGIVEFGKFKNSILKSIQTFQEKSLCAIVAGSMDRILDVAGGEDE
jgi:hypothetical protein